MNVSYPSLRAEALDVRYGDRLIIEALDLAIPDGELAVIIGPNACGKSTLLRALSRLLTPSGGRVLLDGKDIVSLPTKQVARRLGFLPQSPSAPQGLVVGDLVARGRYAHQSFLRQWSHDDEDIVLRAMRATRVEHLADRGIDELSGGQRQRVWLALALAQDTPLLLLDEPTTYLDVVHQIEVLDLCHRIRDEHGKTLVLVLHDLNQTARYADRVIAMRDGAIRAVGTPAEVFTPDRIQEVFGLAALVVDDPETGTPMVVPRASQPTRGARDDH